MSHSDHHSLTHSLTHSLPRPPTHSPGQSQPGPSTDPLVSSIFHAHPKFPCTLQSCIFPQGIQESVLLASPFSMSVCWFPE